MRERNRAVGGRMGRWGQIGRGLIISTLVLALEMIGSHSGTWAAPNSAPLRQTIPTPTPVGPTPTPGPLTSTSVPRPETLLLWATPDPHRWRVRQPAFRRQPRRHQ